MKKEAFQTSNFQVEGCGEEPALCPKIHSPVTTFCPRRLTWIRLLMGSWPKRAQQEVWGREERGAYSAGSTKWGRPGLAESLGRGDLLSLALVSSPLSWTFRPRGGGDNSPVHSPGFHFPTLISVIISLQMDPINYPNLNVPSTSCWTPNWHTHYAEALPSPQLPLSNFLLAGMLLLGTTSLWPTRLGRFRKLSLSGSNAAGLWTHCGINHTNLFGNSKVVCQV